MISKGDILLLSFPFTNLKTSKVRPALVVSSDSFNKISNDAIFLFITSKLHKSPFDIRINKSDHSFKSSGLKGSSTFRVFKLMCMEKKLAKRRLGHADDALLKKIDTALKHLFNVL